MARQKPEVGVLGFLQIITVVISVQYQGSVIKYIFRANIGTSFTVEIPTCAIYPLNSGSREILC